MLLLVVGHGPSQGERPIDWRSRAELGLEVVYEVHERFDSFHPSGGGTLFETRGTLRDIVFSEDARGFGGLRVETSDNTPTVTVSFFHVAPSGRVDDTPPLDSFLRRFPSLTPRVHDDQLEWDASTCAAGQQGQREVVLRDAYFADQFGSPVLVEERVHPVAGEGAMLSLERVADVPEGILNAAGTSRLFFLSDERRFFPREGVVRSRHVEMRTSFTTTPMIDDWVCDVREVAHPYRSPEEVQTLFIEAELLRTAEHRRRGWPQEARLALQRYAALDHHLLQDVADAIAKAVESDEAFHQTLIGAERERHSASEWTALGLSEDQLHEAIGRGMLSAVVGLAGLDSPRHLEAYLRRAERDGLAKAAIDVLRGLYETSRSHAVDDLRDSGISTQRHAEATALLQAQLAALERAK